MSYRNKINSYPASAAFNKIKSPGYASDYIKTKKLKYSFCAPNICQPNKNIGSSSKFLDLKAANNLAFYTCADAYDSTQLYSNLYTELNLNPLNQANSGVYSYVKNGSFSTPILLNTFPPSLINTSGSAAYSSYTVDPSGNLFGNDICGQQNWQNFVVFNTSLKKIL